MERLDFDLGGLLGRERALARRLQALLEVARSGAGFLGQQLIRALLDRGDYWQCAFLIAKGKAELPAASNSGWVARS